ncbi:MAG: amidase [Pseudomonadota bacterium]
MRNSLAIFTIGLLSACSPTTDPISGEAAPASTVENFEASGWISQTLPEQAAALQAGEITSEALTQAYLDRIEAVDRNGPTLRAVLTINPNALADARTADAARDAGEPLGLLHGVPILLKDNIESKDNMPTTAGALALKDNVTGRDSPLVEGLRREGAIILGKTNLSQWANFRSTSSMSGWSALGGQVKNPHILDRNPCGSSSGSGAAMAASLAAGTVGTETNGSIICPSNVNGIVGFKPTVGLVSQDLIVPISSTQDTAGPMTKTVTGAAMMLTAMASGDARIDYVAALDQTALEGARIGVLRYSLNNNADINAAFENALEDMAAAGAILVDVENHDPGIEGIGRKGFHVLKYEFKATLNTYLATLPTSVPITSLAELIEFNNDHADVELVLFDQDIFEQSDAYGDLTDEAYQTALADILRASRENGIDRLMADHEVDILVSPSGVLAPRIDPVNGDVWPSWAGAGSMAARAGYPHATVPMGSVHGLPIGLSFIGGKDQDARVLSFAFSYEQATRHRIDPLYIADSNTRPELAAALERYPSDD